MTPREIDDIAQILIQTLDRYGFRNGTGGNTSSSNNTTSNNKSSGNKKGRISGKTKEVRIDSSKSFIDSMYDSMNANKSMAERLTNLGKSTEYITNKYLDVMIDNLKGFSTGFKSGVDRVDAAMKAQVDSYVDNNPKNFIDNLNKLSAALDESAEELKKSNVTTFSALTNTAQKLVSKSDVMYELVLSNANRFGTTLSDNAKAIAKQMKKGTDVSDDDIKALAAELDESIPAIKRFIDDNIKNTTKLTTKTKFQIAAQDQLTKALNMASLSIAGFSTLFAAGLKGIYTDYRLVTSAGLAGRFGEISMAGLQLGVSVEKLTAIYRENARSLAMGMGTDFLQTLSDGQNGLMRLGLKAEEAAVGANGFYKNAIASGLNPRQTDKLNSSIKFQTDAFKDLRSITGATIEEFNTMNESLAANIDNIEMSLRFAPQERAARFQELISLRNEFTQRGLTAKAADSMVQAMQGFDKTKMKDKFEAAARLQQAASLMGMGNQAAEIAQLSRKRTLSGDEKVRLGDLTAELKGRMEQFAEQGVGQWNLVDSLDEGLGGAAKGLLDASVQLKAAADAQMAVTKGELASEANKNTVSKTEAAGMMTLDRAVNLINSSLGKILIAIIGLGAIFAINRGKGGIGSLSIDIVTNAIKGFNSGFINAFKTLGTTTTDLFKNKLIPNVTKFFSSGILGMFSTLGGGIMSSFMGVISLVGKFIKFAGPIGIVVSLITAGIEMFNKFSSVLKFDSLLEFSKSIGGLFLLALGELGSFVLRIPEFVADAFTWILKGILPEWIIDKVQAFSNMLANLRDSLDNLVNSAVGWLLGLKRSDEENKKIEENEKRIKSEKAVAAATKDGTKAIEDKTTAVKKEKTAEELIGLTSGAITANSLKRDVATDIIATKKEAGSKEPEVTGVKREESDSSLKAVKKTDISSNENKPIEVKVMNVEPILMTLDKSITLLFNNKLSSVTDKSTITDFVLAFAKATPLGILVETVGDVFEKFKNIDGINTDLINPTMDKLVANNDINNQFGNKPTSIDTLATDALNLSTPGIYGKKITLEDIFKKLDELLIATKDDTETVTLALSRSNGSKFKNGQFGLLA